MEFLLDTNVISELALRYPDERVVQWISAHSKTLVLSYAAVAESARGAELLRIKDPTRADAFDRFLQGMLQTPLLWLPLTPAVAVTHGKMMGTPSLNNIWTSGPAGTKPRAKLDLLVAAQAIEARLPVATLNRKDFLAIDEHFKLPGIYDPKEDTWIRSPWEPTRACF
ncbi:PIN domain-containing protein [Foliimonas ilicis]